jgi:hypothetical protein
MWKICFDEKTATKADITRDDNNKTQNIGTIHLEVNSKIAMQLPTYFVISIGSESPEKRESSLKSVQRNFLPPRRVSFVQYKDQCRYKDLS